MQNFFRGIGKQQKRVLLYCDCNLTVLASHMTSTDARSNLGAESCVPKSGNNRDDESFHATAENEASELWDKHRRLATIPQREVKDLAFFGVDHNGGQLRALSPNTMHLSTPEASNFALNFSDSIKKRSIPAEDLSLQASPKRTKPVCFEDNMKITQPVFGDVKETTEETTKEAIKEATKETAKKSPSISMRSKNITTLPPRCSAITPKIKNLRVPCGVCAGDSLRVFDIIKMHKSNDHLQVPRGVYDGNVLEYADPPAGYKVLSGDGDAYMVGGTPVQQHGVRLAVHRETCTDKHCNFLGCNDVMGRTIFKDVDKREFHKYRRFWLASRRAGVKRKMCELRDILA